MRLILSLLVLALGGVANACPPQMLYAPVEYAPSYSFMQRSYQAAYAPQYLPSPAIPNVPSFVIINNNNNNGGGVSPARGLRSSSLVVPGSTVIGGATFVPTVQNNFIGRRAFRFGRGVVINP